MKKVATTFAVVLGAVLLLAGCDQASYDQPPSGYSQDSGGGLFSAFNRPRSAPPRYVSRNSRGHRQAYR